MPIVKQRTAVPAGRDRRRITSPTGAVIRDILHRLDDRFPRHVLMWPVPVQGDGAATKIAAAIDGFNALEPGGKVPRPDVLIVARGGGSLEDLWQFNEEVVVRATAASEIPLISAVGHETDTTLIDYASDRRAPTPTAAAEMAVPVRGELLAQVLDDDRRMIAAAGRLMEDRRTRIDGLARGLPRPAELLESAMQSLDNATDRLATSMSRQTERAGGAARDSGGQSAASTRTARQGGNEAGTRRCRHDRWPEIICARSDDAVRGPVRDRAYVGRRDAVGCQFCRGAEIGRSVAGKPVLRARAR
jgi:exodeoxyribonuclease VII large subunit